MIDPHDDTWESLAVALYRALRQIRALPAYGISEECREIAAVAAQRFEVMAARVPTSQV